MRRRRLRLNSSSDEEEGEGEEEHEHHHQQQQLQQETLIPPSNPNHSPLEISDDDFLDVPENLSPPSPNPPPIPTPGSNQSSNFPSNSISYSPIDQFLRNLGLNLRREWLDSCISLLNTSVPGFSSLDVAGKAELCFQQFVVSDMNFSGAGVLPENVHSLHLVDLKGPFVLQVDEIVNISCPLKERYKNANAGIKRCLKLSMTDGDQRLFGMEYRPIKDLQVLAPAGLKVAIHNVHIRRGLLVLVPEVLDVLGGVVEDLDAARQRLVQEVNKPPRGKRKKTGSVPSLASRATRAAWPSNNVNDQAHANTSTAQHTSSFEMSDQGAAFGTDGVDARGRTVEDHFVPNAWSNAESNPGSNPAVDRDGANMIDARTRTGFVPSLVSRATLDAWPSNNVSDHGNVNTWTAQHTSSFRMSDQGAAYGTDGVDMRGRTVEDHFVPNARINAESNPASNPAVDREGTNMIDARTRTGYVPSLASRANLAAWPFKNDQGHGNILTAQYTSSYQMSNQGTAGVDMRGPMEEDLFVVNARLNAEPNPPSNPVVDLEEINMIDARIPTESVSSSVSRATFASSPSNNVNDQGRANISTTQPTSSLGMSGRKGAAFVTAGVATRVRTAEDIFVPHTRSNAEPNAPSNPVLDLEETNRIDASIQFHGDGREGVVEVFADPSVRPSAEPIPSSNAPSDVRDTDMADEVEHPSLPNGDKETPFTYLASLFAKWTAREDEDTPSVQGKVKCFLTGVKEFHFKERSTFKLHVYVDDGSLISEIIIDHNVVQKVIGHSPKEVTAALTSSVNSIVSGMKEAMKQFQIFLINFEGIVLVEINNRSPLPVALEMKQGCSSSDTLLLLRRLKMLTSPQTPRHRYSEPIDPIDISP